MAEINTAVWGDSTEWNDVAVYDQTLAPVQRCEKTEEVIDLWQDTRLAVNTPWDKTLSYCGLGMESPLSNVKFLRRVKPYFIYPENWDGSKFDQLVANYDADDTRDVTNFAIGYTEVYSSRNQYACQFKSDMASLSLEQYAPIFQRWAPLSRADEAMQWTIDHQATDPDEWCNVASSIMYAQIPVKNFVAIPYITCVNSVATRNLENLSDLSVVDLATYLTAEQDEQHPHASYLTHPYILQVCLKFAQSGNLNDFNSHTRDILLSPSTCFILDETNMYSDINPDCVADDEEGYNLSAAYMYNQLMNWFGTSNDGMPIIGLTSTPGSYHWRDGWSISFTPQDIYQYGDSLPDLKDVSGRYNFPIWIGSEYLEERVLMNENPTTASEATDGAYIYYMSAGNDPAVLREKIRRAVACFGLFFVDGYEDRNLALDDNRMMLGILENGVGHGDYSFGLNNRLQDQWTWDDMHENEYDPSVTPEEPETDPSGTPILPSDPGFTTAGKGTACYAMTYLDIDEMMEDIFGSTTAKYKELVEGLAMFGSNPMNAFVSCKWYPFVFSSPRNSPVILGSTVVNNNHQYDVIDGTDVSFTKFTGSVKIKTDKNFIWSRRTKARLFLPFYGFYELPMNMLMSYTCQVEFHYNIPDEMATWIISFGNVIYDFVECDPSIEVPLTGDNAREIMLTKRQMAANYALTGLAVVSLIATAGVSTLEAFGAMNAATASATSVGSIASTGLKTGLSSIAKGYLPTAAAAIGAGVAIDNRMTNLARTLGNLSVNVPTHGGTGATTFLNLPLTPYIQLYQPAVLSDYKEAEYKLKIGIACDKWCKISEMPENSLLKAGGIADNSTSGMELGEIEELNTILQTGFYR